MSLNQVLVLMNNTKRLLIRIPIRIPLYLYFDLLLPNYLNQVVVVSELYFAAVRFAGVCSEKILVIKTPKRIKISSKSGFYDSFVLLVLLEKDALFLALQLL